MTFIDTHTHLYLPEFNEDRKEIINRAILAGITKFVLPNIESSCIESMLQLTTDYPNNCYAMMGLHPCSVKENYEEELAIVKQYLDKQKFVAIGEIGIDLYWDKTFFVQQQLAFKQQVNWAFEFDLPFVIHCRNAFDEIYELLLELKMNKPYKGVFHCFSGNVEQANKVIELGFYLGIGGVLTYKNSGLDAVMKEIDLKHIVLETDSPYLAPVPYRGKRNESAYIINIATKLAEIKQCDSNVIAEITSSNANQLFGKL